MATNGPSEDKGQRLPSQSAQTMNVYLCDILNFGDQFNRDLSRKYFSNHQSRNVIDKEIDRGPGVMCLGSILDRTSDFFEGIILGTGFMFSASRKSFYHATVLATRGRLTADRVLTHRCRIHFDPGILASTIYPESNKCYMLGVVPHACDKHHPEIERLKQNNPSDVLIVDVEQPPEVVIPQISSCCFVASSSLHGIVVADSYLIPSAWLRLSDNVSGNGFKFYDYKSGYGQAIRPYGGDLSSLAQIVAACERPRGVAEKISLADQIFSKAESQYFDAINKCKPTRTIDKLYRRVYRKCNLLYGSRQLTSPSQQVA